MRVSKQGDSLACQFNSMEAHILHRVFRTIAENYRTAPADFDPRCAAAWYSTQGCQAARLSAEETRDWLENLHQLKSARLDLVRQWTEQIVPRSESHHRLAVRLEDAPTLLTVLNDHRLLVSARHDIGQAEMDLNPFESLASIAGDRQMALLEVHFLAWIMEEILAHLPGNPGGWNS